MILSIILVLSFLLRIYNLGNEDLWVDEIFSINVFNNSSNIIRDTNPPLYYFILYYWSRLFGYGEFITRFPSVIAGVISTYVIYRLGKILFNKEVGILSAFILSISLFHIRYSQEARAYSFIVLFVLLSNYYLVKILKENKESKGEKYINKIDRNAEEKYINKIDRNAIGYIVFTVATLYTHYYGIFYIIFQNLYYLLVYRKDKRNNIKLWIILQGTILLLFIPWIPFMIRQMAAKGLPYVVAPTLDRLYRTFGEFTGSDISLYLFIVIVITGLILYKKNKKNKKNKIKQRNFIWPINIIFLLFWLFIPIIIPFIISQSRPMFVDRYVIASLPAMVLLISITILNFRKIFIISILLVIFIIPTVSSLGQYYQQPQKEEWKYAVKYIEDHQKANDFIIVFPEFRGLPFSYYYNGSNLKASNNATDIDNIIKRYNRIWFVSTVVRKDFKDELEDIQNVLSKNYIRSNKTVKFKNIKIDLYNKRHRTI